MAEDDLFGLVKDELKLPPTPPRPIVSLSNEPDDNPFGESEEVKKLRAGAAVVGNQDTNAAQYRKSIQLGNQNKVDPELIDVDQPAWEKDFKVQENLRIARDNKAVREFLISDPMAGKAAKDELPLLDRLTNFISDAWMFRQEFNPFVNPQNIFKNAPGEKAAAAVPEGQAENPFDKGPKPTRIVGWSDAFVEAQENFNLGVLKQQYQNASIDARPAIKLKIDEASAKIAARPEARDSYVRQLFGGFLGQTYESLPYLAPHTVAGTAAGSAAGALYGSAFPGIGTAAGMVGGFAWGTVAGTAHGFAVVTAQQSAGNIFYAVDGIEGLSETDKQMLAFTGGLAAGMLEAWGGAMVTSAVQQIVTKIAADAIGKQALKEFAVTLASTQIQGAAVNGGQQLAEILVENIGKAKGDVSLATIFNDKAATQKMISDVTQASIDGLVLASVIGGPAALKRGTRAGDVRITVNTLAAQKKLDEIVQMSEESKLKQEAPNIFANALAHQEPDPLLHIDPALVKQYKSAFDFIPDISKQLIDAEALGTEIKVKQSDLVAHIDKEVYMAIKDGIRQGPDAMSPQEALKLQLKEQARQELEAAKAAEEAATKPEVIQSTDYVKPGQTVDVSAASTDIVSKVQAGLDAGAKVTLVIEDRPIEITSITQGMMTDAQGQRWGVLPVLQPSPGKRSAIDITPATPAVPPKIQMSDADLVAGIFGRGPISPEAAPAMPSTIKLPEILVGPEPTTLPPAVVSRGQALIDRFFGKGRAVPTEEQMTAYIQAENIRNLQAITPLQQASVSPTPEALSVAPEGFTETAANRPITPAAEFISPASNANKVVADKLDVEIGPAATKSLIEQFREVMEAAPPGDLGEAVLARALSRRPGNLAEFNRFIDEEARILEIKDIKEIKERAQAALAALGTRLIKEETASVVNGLTDPDAKRAAQATAQAIDYQRHIMAMTPLFTAGEGMTTAERAVHEQHLQDVQAQLSESVFKAAREITERKETKRWEDEKARMRPEVEEYIAETPAIMADEYFRTGHSRVLGEDGPKLQMTKEGVDAVFTPEELEIMDIKTKKLSNSVLFKGNKWAKEGSPNSASPDVMAEMFGYPTGADMLLDLMQYRDSLKTMKETQEQRVERLVNQELDRRMMAQHGNLNKIIADNSLLAAGHIAQERVFVDELNALSALSGKDLINVPELRTLVDERMRDMTNAQATNTREYENLAGKHGRLAKEAKDAGDMALALQEKKLQLQASMMAKWAVEHRKEVTLGKTLTGQLTRVERVAEIDPEVNTRMLQLIAQSGLNPGKRGVDVLQRDIMALKEPSLTAWIKDRNDKDNADTIPTPTYLNGPVLPLKSLDEMKVNAFNEYYATMRAMEFTGKKAGLVGERGKQLALDDTIKVLQEQLADLTEGRGYKKYGDPVQPPRGIMATIRGYQGNLLRAETVAMKADRLQDDGILNRVLITPLKDSQKTKNDTELSVAKYLKTVDHGEWSGPPGARINTLGRKVPNDTIMAPNGQPREFRADEMLMVALNWGNGTNRHIVANTLKTDQTVINDWLMKNMTEKNWDYVQNIWDMYKKEINPLRDDVYRNTRGFGMEYPDPIKFTDAHGKSREGGYFPIMKHRAGMPEGKQLSDPGLVDTRVYDALPANSHRQVSDAAKLGEDIQVTLSFHEVPHRIREDIHELSFREAVQNAAKIVNDKRFYNTIHDAFGKDQADIFKPWIQNISNNGGKSDMQAAWSARWMFNKIQSNTVTTLIGFNPQTMLIHSPTALFNTLGETGPYTVKALRAMIGDSKLAGLTDQMFRSPEAFDEMAGFALRNSAELATRIRNKERDIAHSLGQWGKYENLQYNAEWLGQAQIAYTDYTSAAWAWWGGYLKAIDDGFSEKEAYRLGDRTVRLAHNSANLMDKSQFTADRAMRGFAQFYGFFNHVVNQVHLKGFNVAEKIRKAEDAKTYWDTGKALGGAGWTATSALMFYGMSMAYIHYLVRGEPKNDEHWGVTAAKEFGGLVGGLFPGGREATYPALHGEYARASIPLTTAFDIPRRLIRDIKKWSSKVDLSKPSTVLPPAQITAEMLGTFGRVPFATKQTGKWLEELQRMERGEVKPPMTFTDWWNYYTRGRSKPIGSHGSRRPKPVWN